MRPNPRSSYRQKRCAMTQNFRCRMRAAETQAADARAETALIRAQTEAELAVMRGDIRAERAQMQAERAALTEFIESPEWQRDLLALARQRVRAEMTALSITRKSCKECGSFGRGFYNNILNAEIDALNKTHGLAPDRTPDSIDWPVRMGIYTRRGKALNRDWQTPEPEPRRRDPRADIW